MHPNVAISGLFACSIGISAAGTTEGIALRQETGITAPTKNSIVTVTGTYPNITEPAILPRRGNLTFWFETTGAEISTVKLKLYNITGLRNGDGDGLIADPLLYPSSSTPDTDGKVMLNSDEKGTVVGFHPEHGLLRPGHDNSIIIAWDSSNSTIVNQPLYLEFEWTKSPNAGSSTTQLFAVYDGPDSSRAMMSLNDVRDGSDIGSPARQEIETVMPTSPTPSPSPEASTPPASETTSQPVASGGDQSPSPAPNGLNKNGIIGVAVGVTVGGLLVAGTLLWLFCFRRRRRSAAHHAMPSYASDVGVHAMMQDKEIPVALESSSPRSAYGGGGGGGGGGGDEGRPSTDHYAPYSDRSTTSPTPDHRRTTSGAAAAAAASADVDATSQTDPSRTRGAPTPTPVIMSRYAHLVEEGMTDDEIRRLEEEERQLDAAIENAGRR